ncbi:MAG: hypothetical protein ACRYG7_09735 [Janthinobacterium lividum]
MHRKLFSASQLRRMIAVGTLLLAGSVAHAQEAVPARMWAATARYVYADDPNIKPLVAKLNAALGQPQTLGDFEQKLLAASNEVAQLSKTPNVRVLQRQFRNMRAMNALELFKNLPDSLGKMPARSSGDRKQKLTALSTELMTLAQGSGTVAAAPQPVGAAPAEVAPQATSVAQPSVGAPAAPATSPLLWAALAMSGLSLLGVLKLLRDQGKSSGNSEAGRGQSRSSTSRELSPEQYQEVERMINKALGNQAGNKPAVKTTTLPPPPQSTKQKLTNAAKTTRPPSEAPTASLPPLASLAPDEPTTPAAPASAAPVAPLPAPVPFTVLVPQAVKAPAAIMEPGTSIELDPTPAAGPAQRLQFVNEAPFNNAFAARTLSDAPATYSIYEIVSTEQKPDVGQFRVVGNLVSHISNHRNILEPVCEYVSYPQGGETRIITEHPGEVHRRGADWEIVRRARIRFE